MNLHSTNPRARIITAAFMLLLFAGIAICSDTDKSADNPGVKSAADNNNPNGPTVTLDYDGSKPVKNPSSSFMYFIPLIAPTRVDMDISPDNRQQAWILSYNKKVTKKPSTSPANLKCAEPALSITYSTTMK